MFDLGLPMKPIVSLTLEQATGKLLLNKDFVLIRILDIQLGLNNQFLFMLLQEFLPQASHAMHNQDYTFDRTNLNKQALKETLHPHKEKSREIEVDDIDTELLLNISEMVGKKMVGTKSVDEPVAIVEVFH